jgi:hypothetical protein
MNRTHWQKILCILAVSAMPAFAQPKGEQLPEFVVLTYSDIKPESTDNWYRSQATLSEALRKAGFMFRNVNAPVFGDNRFMSVTPMASITEFDQGLPTERAMGKPAYDKWAMEVRKMSNSQVTRVLLKRLPDLAILDAPRGSLPLSVVTRTRVAPDRAADYVARIKNDVLPTQRKSGVKRSSFWRVIAGGGSNEFISFSGYSSLADAERQIQAIAQRPPAAGVVLSTERTVYRVHRESSFTK